MFLLIMAVCAVGVYLVLLCPAWPWRKRPVFSGCVWYAHRGLHDENVSENSILAFEAAAKNGYGIELDVRLTKDNYLVVFHDDTLHRLCGIPKAVRAMNWQQLQEVRLPDGQGIPLFSEVLRQIGGRVPVIVEIKSNPTGNCAVSEKLWKQLRGYPGAYMVQSFDPFQLRWFKKHAPGVLRGQLAQKGRFDEPFRVKHLPQILAGNLVFNRLSAPDYIAYRQEDTKKLCYRIMRTVYHPGLAVWTVRSEEEAEKMKAQCDAIIFENFHPENKGGIKHE